MKSKSNFAIALSVCAGCMIASAHGVTWYVDDSAPPGRNGQSWLSPFQTIQQAVLQASTPNQDEIRVGQGIYKPSSQTTSIDLKDKVRIRGGYAGYGAADPNLHKPSDYPTILSGDLNNNDGPNFTNYTDNARHVVRSPAGTSPPDAQGLPIQDKVNLDSVTIKGANNNDVFNPGGGLVITESSPVIRNCIITLNQSPSGAGIGCVTSSGTTVVRNCTITNNHAFDYGAGLYAASGGASIKVLNTTFSDNVSDQFGGGAYVGAEVVRFIACSFLDNEATEFDGGGLHCSAEDAQVTNCLFAGNIADDHGGGIYTEHPLTVTNCTIADNEALEGFGGGVLDQNNPGDLMVVNSIAWGNQAALADSLADEQIRGQRSITYSDVEGGPTTGGNINSDPMFDENGGYRLDCDSPCVNRGLDSAVPADGEDVNEANGTGEATPDLDLKKRIVGLDADGNEVDMGAYEKQNHHTCPGDANNDGTVNVHDLLFVIARWGQAGQGDVNPHPCGDGLTNVDDLLFVISKWGQGCPGFSGGGPSAPQSVEDCHDTCMGEEFQTEQGYWDCIDACIESLCLQALIPDCGPES